jgi:hypothetical protein
VDRGDIELLMVMRDRLTTSPAEGAPDLMHLAHDLLELRDQLRFRDPGWERSLTHHLATIDSASTFRPADDDQARARENAVATAKEALLRLVQTKLGDSDRR